ncbi:MAG: hypothetical protein NTY01_03265 [Verrucomicrobia bacterium]|nr:hypothetical protein [Verrucomicrobiota bacterium]
MKTGIGKLGDIGLVAGNWTQLGQTREDYCAAMILDDVNPTWNRKFAPENVGFAATADGVVTVTSSDGTSPPYIGAGVAGCFLAAGLRRFSIQFDWEWDLTAQEGEGLIDVANFVVQIWAQDYGWTSFIDSTVWAKQIEAGQHDAGSDAHETSLLNVGCICPVWLEVSCTVKAANQTSFVKITPTILFP